MPRQCNTVSCRNPHVCGTNVETSAKVTHTSARKANGNSIHRRCAQARFSRIAHYRKKIFASHAREIYRTRLDNRVSHARSSSPCSSQALYASASASRHHFIVFSHVRCYRIPSDNLKVTHSRTRPVVQLWLQTRNNWITLCQCTPASPHTRLTDADMGRIVGLSHV